MDRWLRRTTHRSTSDRTVANIKKDLPSPKISGIQEVKCYRNGKLHSVRIASPTNTAGETSKSNTQGEQESIPLSAQETGDPENSSSSATSSSGGAQESLEPDLPYEHKVELLHEMKMLHQKCLSYSHTYDSINDGNRPVSDSVLEKFCSQLLDLSKQAEHAANLITQIKEKICAHS